MGLHARVVISAILRKRSHRTPIILKPRAIITKPVSVSVGSIGHPHSCAPACKYNGKKTGCKDGQLCDRCHICRWSRCTDRATNADAQAVGEAKAPSPPGGAKKEMSTQTT